MENEEEMKYLLFLLFIHLLGSVLFHSFFVIQMYKHGIWNGRHYNPVGWCVIIYLYYYFILLH